MKLRFWGTLLSVLALLALAGRQAHARWLEMHVTPLSTSADGRSVHVSIKDVGQEKACRVVIVRDKNARHRFQKGAYGSLALAPEDGAAEHGVTAVPMTEKRDKDRIIFTFRVTAEQLPRLRFEFWDRYADDPRTLAGGNYFWLLPRDFTRAPVPAPAVKPI